MQLLVDLAPEVGLGDALVVEERAQLVDDELVHLLAHVLERLLALGRRLAALLPPGSGVAPRACEGGCAGGCVVCVMSWGPRARVHVPHRPIYLRRLLLLCSRVGPQERVGDALERTGDGGLRVVEYTDCRS